MTKDEAIKDLKSKCDSAKNNYVSNFETNVDYFRNLWKAKRRPLTNAARWRANIFYPLIPSIIMDILPRMVNGLIGKGDFYAIKGANESDKIKEAVQTREELTKVIFRKGGFFKAVSDACQYGMVDDIGFIKSTWKYEKGKKEYYDVMEGKVVIVDEENVEYDSPIYEAVKCDKLYYDPKATCWNEVTYTVEEMYVTLAELKQRASIKAYDKAEINKFIKDKELKDEENCADRFCIHLVYSKNHVAELLEGDYLIRRHITPFKNRRGIPYFPLVYYPEAGQITGRGICNLLADIQEHINDMVCLKADNMVLRVNSSYVMKRDIENPVNLEIGPGSITEMDNPREDIINLQMGGDINSAFNEIEQFSGFANRTVGTPSSLLTPEDGVPMPNKTATAANIATQSMITRFSTVIDNNLVNCIVPLFQWTQDLIEQYMTPDRAIEMLGEKGKNYTPEKMNEDLKVEYTFIITGQDGLKSKQEKLNSLTQGLNLMSILPNAQADIDWKYMLKEIVKNMELPKEIILDGNAVSPNTQVQLEELAKAKGIPVEEVMQMAKSEMNNPNMAGGQPEVPVSPQTPPIPQGV